VGFVRETVASDELELPTAIAFAPNNTIFIAEKRGVVRVWQNGAVLPPPFIDLQDEVNQNGDRGLLGLALHPNFPATPFVYLLYVYDPPGVTPDGDGARVARLLRVTADAANPLVAATETDSRVVLLGKNSTLANIGNPNNNLDETLVACQNSNGFVQDCLPDDFPAHTIGQVSFGPDGKLYVSNGDGGTWLHVDARNLRVQALDSLAGKLMRLDPETGAGLPDNPFYDGDPNSNRSKVFNYGLRNPFRFTFLPTTREMFIGDVGWGEWEEINRGRGKNFGWPCYEGANGENNLQVLYADNPQTAARCRQLDEAKVAQAPWYGYTRELFGASITMGTFYTGTAWPAAYRGALFIADYNNNWIKYVTTDAQGHPQVHDFSSDEHPVQGAVQIAQGPDEQLYYVAVGEVSGVYRLRYVGSGNQPPVAKLSANVTQGAAPLTVNFSSAGSTDPEGQTLTYQWTFGDGTTSELPHPTKTYSTPGNYRVRLTVTDEGGLAHFAELEIIVGNNRPTLSVSAPLNETRYRTGDVIRFSATASDPEDGDISARIQWKALLHHNEHVHFDFFSATGGDGSFTVPDHGDGTYFELCANVEDRLGASSETVCRELQPRTVQYAFTSVPSGAEISFESTTRKVSFNVTTIPNSRREISAPATHNGLPFIGWSDGGARSHFITIGDAPHTLTAHYGVPAERGLRAEYFDNVDLTVRKFTRIDGNINYDWLTNSPDPRIGRDTFSARWTGRVMPRFSETYTFSTLSDDGVRLWVNGELIINNWSNHEATEDSATITLEANQRYALQLEYYDRSGTALIKLMWASANQPKEIIPPEQLFQPAPPTTVYVSDLTPLQARNGLGVYQRDRANPRLPGETGGVLTINGVPYVKGLGVYARSELVYELQGRYDSFLTDIGLDDAAGPLGSVVYEVWLDGVKAYDSGRLYGFSPLKRLVLDVSDKHAMRLVVISANLDGANAFANWADARLTRFALRLTAS
jgi:glucose/arabinose dehydrogenase